MMNKLVEEKLKKLLFAIRFPNGYPTCPICETPVSDYKSKNQFECQACRNKNRSKRVRFGIYTNTLLEQTKISAHKIFVLTCAFCSNANPQYVAKDFGIKVSYRSASEFFDKIREAIYREFPQTEYKNLKHNSVDVFGLIHKNHYVSIVPLPELTIPRAYEIKAKNQWGSQYSKYSAFILLNELIKKNENKDGFVDYYESYFVNGKRPSLYSRNYYGYLKVMEYLYNLEKKLQAKNPGLSGDKLLEEIAIHLLTLLLKVQ